MTAPAGTRVEILAEVPALGRSFARGAAGSAVDAARRTLPGAPGGLALPEVAYRVEHVATDLPDVAARLAAYRRVVGEPPPTGPVDHLPAGFLHVLGFPVATALMVRGDFPLPLVGLVHLANAVTLTRPVALGETLRVTAWAENLRPHRRGVQVDLVTEVATSGETAYRGVSTYLAKGFTLPDDVTAAASSGTDDRRETFVAPVPTARWRLDAGTGRAYGAVSGDRNPIHTSALGAKAFGFRRAIAHGMYTAARALAEVGPARGDAYDWSVEFATPVLLPGTVDVAITRGPAGFDYVGWDARHGRPHLTGTVTPRA
ncbi:MaoC dehydratase-like protein [Sediminihabitans luteus]|uniref:MaoC dehydratase-like protein n=1 Tax=Sediminihabitans luteus TaxID=1138585 RepID=A0A2M9D0M6_9CELL|nr:MaoC/PaaZ C-terminal domain-containing protein [Sediminihabitans luteus]PJJ77625.1 MaoC dehydratase-like protein [Sediminihabitans luteus]GII98525.1 hypothetical protein Slu03_09030 [Sediminihabitans luteus]